MSTIMVNGKLSLGTRAKLARVSHGWSQEGVAALTRCRQEDVSRLERGLPIKPKIYDRILKILSLEDKPA